MQTEKDTRSLLDSIKEHAASAQLKLPVFPGVALELQHLLAAENSSIDQVSKVISKDQALASQVLKLANSAFYSGMNRNIRTIKDAIMRLGLNHMFNLVICSSQQSYYKSSNRMLEKYLKISWKHALCVSIGSKWLVQELGHRKLGDEAFLAGFLHDIGKLLILKVIEIINSKTKDIELSDAFISETLESMHSEQGYNLMDKWSIPSVYCNVALNHHKEGFDTSDVVLMAVRVVNQACRKSGITTSTESPIDLMTLPEVHALAIEENVLADLEVIMLDAMQSEYSRLNELKLDSSTPYGTCL